ncbi:MAG: DUF2811 domain-containing protein [Cyanobium sp.]
MTDHRGRGVMVGPQCVAMGQAPDTAPRYVSVVNEFPEDLYDAMRHFVRTHPHWDQYRLMQVAVAGFLFQQGSGERAVARHYLDGLFDRGGSAAEGLAATNPAPGQSAGPGAMAGHRSTEITPEAPAVRGSADRGSPRHCRRQPEA